MQSKALFLLSILLGISRSIIAMELEELSADLGAKHIFIQKGTVIKDTSKKRPNDQAKDVSQIDNGNMTALDLVQIFHHFPDSEEYLTLRPAFLEQLNAEIEILREKNPKGYKALNRAIKKINNETLSVDEFSRCETEKGSNLSEYGGKNPQKCLTYIFINAYRNNALKNHNKLKSWKYGAWCSYATLAAALSLPIVLFSLSMGITSSVC